MQDKYSKAKFRLNFKMQGNRKIGKTKQPNPTIRAEHHGNIEGHYVVKDVYDIPELFTGV